MPVCCAGHMHTWSKPISQCCIIKGHGSAIPTSITQVVNSLLKYSFCNLTHNMLAVTVTKYTMREVLFDWNINYAVFLFFFSFVCSSSVSIIGSNQKSLHMKSVETQIVTLVLVHNKAQECCVFLKLLRLTDKADFPPRNHPN